MNAGRPKFPRRTLVVSFGAVLAVTVGFAWVAVLSFKLIHENLVVGSNLKPVEVVGPQQLVFTWRKQACEPRDIPDLPARAYRDAQGQVHLIASHYVSRQMTGPDLNHVRHDCPVVMSSTYDPRPSVFADKEWIAAVYTTDGKTIFALVHDEYHGSEFPGRCPSGSLESCLYNAVTLARSTDGGRTFVHALPPPSHLVAEVPYRYEADAGPFGVFTPSNIVFKDGYYYSLVSTRKYKLQQGGTCLMRTDRLADPTSWRAWDGGGFDVQFVDPYRGKLHATDHVCRPVSPAAITDMTQSLTYNTYFGKFLLVGTAADYSPRKRRKVWGFYYSLSKDLIHWDERRLIKEVELPQSYRCGDPNPVQYPSVLDPTSTSRNFETTGRSPYLYFTRQHYSGCRQTLNRDLVRVPVRFSK